MTTNTIVLVMRVNRYLCARVDVEGLYPRSDFFLPCACTGQRADDVQHGRRQLAKSQVFLLKDT